MISRIQKIYAWAHEIHNKFNAFQQIQICPIRNTIQSLARHNLIEVLKDKPRIETRAALNNSPIWS
jgi:hypothetical protein